MNKFILSQEQSKQNRHLLNHNDAQHTHIWLTNLKFPSSHRHDVKYIQMCAKDPTSYTPVVPISIHEVSVRFRPRLAVDELQKLFLDPDGPPNRFR